MRGAFIIVACCALVGIARAESTLESSAKTHFELGQTYSSAHRYEEALAEFSAGYELSRKPLFLFNMAECARLAGKPERARELYERYVAEDPSGKLTRVAHERLEDLRVAPSPRAAPGAELVTAPPTDRPRRRHVAPIVVGSLAVASLVIGGALTGAAIASYGSLESSCKPYCDRSSWEQLPAQEHAGEALIGLGLAAAVADVVLWVVDLRRGRPGPVQADGAGLRVRF